MHTWECSDRRYNDYSDMRFSGRLFLLSLETGLGYIYNCVCLCGWVFPLESSDGLHILISEYSRVVVVVVVMVVSVAVEQLFNSVYSSDS